MHRGCLVWTPTPPLFSRTKPRPGPARVRLCVLCLAELSGPVSRARSGAPHLLLWPLCPSSLFGPLRARVALFAVVLFFLFVCAPLLCLALRAFWRGVPWALTSCSPPPPFFFLSFFLPPPALFLLFLPPPCALCVAVLFVFLFSAALFVVVVFFPLPCLLFFFSCRLCGAGSVCVFVAVGRAGVWCCWRCGLLCVVSFAWCCPACLCLAGCSHLAVRRGVALGLVGLFLLFSAVACCCVLRSFFFALFGALLSCTVLFCSVLCSAVEHLAVWRGRVALFLCWLLLRWALCALPCRGASPGSVLCCLFCCVAWVASCLVRCCGVLLCSVCPWARCCVVLLCCLWSVCCRSLCRVSGRLHFCGASLVVLCWCAGVVALYAVLSCPSGAGWCCVLLPVVFGCLLLGLAVPWCLLVTPGIVFWWCCPCLAVWLAALWFGLVCLGAPLRCVVFCGAVLSCGGVLSCSAVCLRGCLCLLFVSCRCAFCCVCPGVVPFGWSACCGALLPCVVSCGAVLSCGVVLSCSGVFLRCCVCLLSLFPFKTTENPIFFKHRF